MKSLRLVRGLCVLVVVAGCGAETSGSIEESGPDAGTASEADASSDAASSDAASSAADASSDADASFETCSPDAAAGTAGACVDQACVNGVCTGVCTPGATQCKDDGVQTCNASGQWGPTAPCTNKQCTNGACSGSCMPGSTQCSGNGVQLCGANSEWSEPIACNGQACMNGACVGVCAPHSLRCAGAQPQGCDGAGTWQDVGTPCSQPTPNCQQGTCTCLGQTCNGACVDLDTDRLNCGSCGQTCQVGERCSAGSCGCDSNFAPTASLGVFVSLATGNDATGNGSAAKPYATIGKAIAAASASALPNVYVAPGTYPESLTLWDAPQGISVQGGWTVTGAAWSRDCTANARASTILVGGTIAVRANDVVHPSGITSMTIRTGPAPATSPDADGASVIGVLVSGAGSRFSLVDVDVVAGDAGAGGTASAGAAGVSCMRGGSDCGLGVDGAEPASASPALQPGTFNETGFNPAPGDRGRTGGSGSPGAPGPSPRCFTVYDCSAGCGFSNLTPRSTVCGGAGVCGCGGVGGEGGSPGRGGGASAAVVVVGAGATVIVTNSALQAGKGGDGSAGASGGQGALGQAGAPGANRCETGQDVFSGGSCGPLGKYTNWVCGARNDCSGSVWGGNGGAGSKGSAGGAGAGGPSYSLVTVSGATATTDVATTLTFDVGGRPGTGGALSGGAAAKQNQ
ncbi:PE family protein [Labilithrix luteola]|uniref:PE family protein n=1 Tax=Labilithrix luteola TaxID=1391654 RepID=A0A0K1QGA7_9BACT|nr:DUF1565 domain-containing protein [Labilithrix luteola]AKV04796.1 PE family protein [Labilithrix luteola]